MAELNNDNASLRAVTLESVAKYLRCDPARLRIALEHLITTPTAIDYGPGPVDAVMVVPADDRLIMVASLMARLLGWDCLAAAEMAVRSNVATRPIEAVRWLN